MNLLLDSLRSPLWQITGLLGVILGIIGILASYIFRSHGVITLVSTSCLRITDNRPNVARSLEINYEGKRIERPVFCVEYCIVNNGNVDIDTDDVHEDACILSCTRRAKLLDVKVLSQDPPFIILPSNTGFILKFNLLKANEALHFGVIAEAEEFDPLVDVSLAGRIKNVSIERRSLVGVSWLSSIKKYTFVLLCTILVFMSIYVGLSIWAIYHTGSDNFSLWDNKYQTYDSVRYRPDGLIELNGIHERGGPGGPWGETMKETDLLGGERFKFIPTSSPRSGAIFLIMALSGTALFLMIFGILWFNVRNYKIIKAITSAKGALSHYDAVP